MNENRGFTVLDRGGILIARYNGGGEFHEFPIDGRSWEWVLDECRENGLTINGQPVSTDELGAAIDQVLNDPNNRARFGANQGQWMHNDEQTVIEIARAIIKNRKMAALAERIRQTGRPMVSKYNGKTIYGEEFGAGANIIYSRDGILLEDK